MKQRILIVEDDSGLARILRDNLVYEAFEVASVADGSLVIHRVREFVPDLVLLDVGLPGMDGFEVCRRLRSPVEVPVIFITARGRKDERLRGLALGADDYITKPFDLEELLARVRVVLRRARPTIDRLSFDDVVVDFEALEAQKGGQRLELTHREFGVLRYLAGRRDVVVSRDELLQRVWGYADNCDTRAIDNAIARIRKKIEPDPHHPRYIRTAHGGGYCWSMGSATRLNA